MTYHIAPLNKAHFEGLHFAFDTVSKEGRFLAFLQAPPKEQTFEYYENVLQHDHAHFVALQGQRVVGWCDALPVAGETRSHITVLGVALLPQARHRGLGAQLMQAVIPKVWHKGFTRIELTVRTDNLNALALYKRQGFAVEGTHRNGGRINSEYHDVYAMALLRDA